jgi:hypothetical protein
MRLNIGCGQTPVAGWRNFDNSPSVALARRPVALMLAEKLGLINAQQSEFVRFAKSHSIEFGDITKGLPLPDRSVEVLYSSHVFEHLDRRGADLFLIEAKRLIRVGGVIRLVVPDLMKLAKSYVADGDANSFVQSSLLWTEDARGVGARIQRAISGGRGHKWMYDSRSLVALLQKHGFAEAREVYPGETRIDAPGPLCLREREDESVYVEALNS